jgi:hypothetical protein
VPQQEHDSPRIRILFSEEISDASYRLNLPLLDSDWSEALHYFKQLPKGKCLLHFGGETDIFKAKEILGGHCCIMGGISPATISVATPEEVDAYCACKEFKRSFEWVTQPNVVRTFIIVDSWMISGPIWLTASETRMQK